MAVGTSALSASVNQKAGINPWLIAITVTLATFNASREADPT
jgi:hypothetical protein